MCNTKIIGSLLHKNYLTSHSIQKNEREVYRANVFLTDDHVDKIEASS